VAGQQEAPAEDDVDLVLLDTALVGQANMTMWSVSPVRSILAR
jgi:hypothetical protein